MNFKLIENVKKYNADYLNVTARLGNCYLIQLWFIGNTNLKTGFTSTSQSLSRFFEIFQMAEKTSLYNQWNQNHPVSIKNLPKLQL